MTSLSIFTSSGERKDYGLFFCSCEISSLGCEVTIALHSIVECSPNMEACRNAWRKASRCWPSSCHAFIRCILSAMSGATMCNTLHSNDLCLALDTVKDAGVVYGDILLRDSLDDFLGDNSASQ